MPIHTFLRGLSTLVANTTLSFMNGSFNASEQNVSLSIASNATSAIPDLSATADIYGDAGFINSIPIGAEVLLCAGIAYMYIHCYIGTPRQIWREWVQHKKNMVAEEADDSEKSAPVIVVGLLDDVSSVGSCGSRYSVQSIDTREILPTV